MAARTHSGTRQFGWFGRKLESDGVAKVDRLAALDQALAEAERRYRWRSAMLISWAAGDVLVGVTKGLDISLFTVRDSTKVTGPYELAEALIHADRFVRQAERPAQRSGSITS